MKYSSRALACLIFYLFFGFHAVTWAGGGKGPSECFKVGIGAEFERAPTQTRACLENDYESESDRESLNKRVAQEIEKIKRELQEAREENLYRKLEEKISEYQRALSDQQAKFQTELSQKEQALKTLETQHQQACREVAQREQELSRLQEELVSQQASYQAYRLARQQSRERKAQAIEALREQLAELQIEYQLGQPGDPGFGVAALPEDSLPPNFYELPGSRDIHSDEYGNYMHQTAGVHVCIPAFVYRIGKQAKKALFEKYGAHAVEVLDLAVYLAYFDAPTRAYFIERFAQGQRGPGDWQLHRAFVNAGEVQAGLFMQKYLASPRKNGRSVTSVAGTVPLSLTSWDGFTRSADMQGCRGELADAYTLAKQTSDEHQVASIFQYSALMMLSLAQAQGAGSNQYCAWWSKDPRFCCPKGCVQDLHDDQKVDLVWQSAGELGDPNKPRTGSCSDEAWASHNGQGNGVMDIKGALWEVAGAVTTPCDIFNSQTLYALGRWVDYILLDKSTAFATQAQLQARGDELVCLTDRVDSQLDGTFALFSGHAVHDALALPKSTQSKGPFWPGYGNSWLNTEDIFANLMPVVGGSWLDGAVAGLCAHCWLDASFYDGCNLGFRLVAYGLTWTAFAQASAENGPMETDGSLLLR